MDVQKKTVLVQAIQVILYHQYVSFEPSSDDAVCYRVVEGAGMGPGDAAGGYDPANPGGPGPGPGGPGEGGSPP